MTAHAKLSASGSEMWLNCAGSINAQVGYENKTSRYALEGTFAHEVADICLTDNIAPFSIVGSVISIPENSKFHKHTVKVEMAEYVQQYIDYIKLYQTAESILYTENKVDFSNIVPDGFGTLDSAVYRPEDNTLHIFDLKYGKGVKVTAQKIRKVCCMLWVWLMRWTGYMILMTSLFILCNLVFLLLRITKPVKTNFWNGQNMFLNVLI